LTENRGDFGTVLAVEGTCSKSLGAKRLGQEQVLEKSCESGILTGSLSEKNKGVAGKSGSLLTSSRREEAKNFLGS